ncbi:EAL domain-containing protein [Wenzhouxiangella sediminis]|uniref:EAL domain-containing protein n=1 Tax=Wenzhouxiangella sediminis TaxID=1792836 RepID=A0A3E1KC72_9GAMM|nr:EAL domain-containing protein [Wenzhouxiangella sediminis]RFF32304.1 EAL domain-containing protein [Wenzhouxiangella sediminis]
MNLSRLSLLSIIGCIAGLVVLLAVTVISTQQLNEKQAAMGRMLDLRNRIQDFTTASASLLLYPTDSSLQSAYRQESQQILEALNRLGMEFPAARKAARRVELIVASVASGLDSEVGSGLLSENAARSRIVMQQVIDNGIVLSAALDNALRDRRQAIASEAARIRTLLIAAALLFGALCVIAFGLIHARIARPARHIAATLDHIRSGNPRARADVGGNDELSRLAHTLNRTLDERDEADRQLAERQDKLHDALAKLADTRDRLLRAQSVANIGSWDLDPTTRKLTWSDQVYWIFGLRSEEFSSTVESFFESVHANDRHWLREHYAGWLKRGGPLDVKHRIVRPDGEVRWVREMARVVPDEHGRPTSATGTVQDITEQHLLDERQRQFQQLIEGSEDWYGIIDENYRFLWANRAYAERYDLEPESLPGRMVADVIGEAYFEQVIRPKIDRCLEGEAQRFETRRDLPHETDRHLLVRYYPIHVPGRSSRRVGAVITDITNMRRVEEEAARQGQLLDMAGRAARFGAWSVELGADRIEWSDTVAAIHGMPSDPPPTVEEAMSFYAPEYRGRIREVFEACTQRGEPYDEELQLIDAGGERRWVRTIGEAVHDDTDDIVRVQGSFQDITEQKALEIESRRLSDRLATMLESITDGFVAFDEQWRYTYVNPKAEALLGKSAQELLGATVWSQFPGLAGTGSERALKRAMDERATASAEEFFEPLDGWFDMRAYPWEGGVAAYFRDVTENHRMLERLRAQEAALRNSTKELNEALDTRQVLINSLPAHIAMLDEAGVIVDVNDQWRHFGEQNAHDSADFGVGTNYVELCESASGACSDEAESVARGLKDVLRGTRESFALEYPCHSPEEQRWFRVMFNRLAADEDDRAGAVAMHIDITARKQAEQQINRLAYEDPLTGVLSRNGFVRKLNERLGNDGWPNNGILAMVDVVNQHDINDAHGYEMGDLLLTGLSRRLTNLVDDQGLAGRTGGDEFVVYFPMPADYHPESFLEGLEQCVEQPFLFNGGKVAVEIDLRIGYTALGDRRRSTDRLIREAELALFEQRRSASTGQSRLAYTNELKKRTRERIELTNELRRALDAEEFELHFQPKVNLSDGSMISAEALIRWRHPQRGLLSPGVFIPVAEQSQLIGPIGDWALRAACRQLNEWRRHELDAVRVAVNVSQVQFMLGDFSAKVQAALEDFNVDPDHLSLEITESVFERHSDRMLSEIRELHTLGVRLSLDDFGTGYSSLLYLQRYPFDEIKIDRGFVDRILEDRYSRDIVLAVVNLAGALDAEVVAEGIESKEIAAALLEMGCLYGQGFYYSLPMTSEDFRWLLHQRSKLPLDTSSKR